jgi:hypothetical protein
MAIQRAGSRGGPQPPMTLAIAQSLFETWRKHEYGWVRAHIIETAGRRGEYHADNSAELQVAEPNVIGAAVNALAKSGLIEKLNAEGRMEHRRARAAASHARASYVWRLTSKGERLYHHLVGEIGMPDQHQESLL